jgi:hypothetical protein
MIRFVDNTSIARGGDVSQQDEQDLMTKCAREEREAGVVDIPNGYTSDVVSYQQTRVAHGGGMADSQPGGLVAGGMAN